MLLLCGATVFLPFTVLYAAVRCGAWRLGGDTYAAALRPEVILATPDVEANDDEYLKRIDEMERAIKRGNEKAAEQQRAVERVVQQLEEKLDARTSRLEAKLDARFDQLCAKLDAIASS